VGIKNVELENIQYDNDDEGLVANVRVTLNNYGNLPATKTRIVTLLAVSPVDESSPSVEDQLSKIRALNRRMRSIQDLECSPTNIRAGDLDSGEILTSSDGPSIFPKESSEVTVLAEVAGPSSTFQHKSGFYLPACFRYSFGEDRARLGSTFFVLEISPNEPAKVFDISTDGEISPAHAILLADRTRAD
jgi:hypothetical protein